MVGITFSTSVVHRIKITCAGGSSNVFNSALKEFDESMCISSIIYTLYLDIVGRKDVFSKVSLICSTRVLDAASISIISGFDPLTIDLHTSHSPHGSSPFGFKQLIAFAKTLAIVVLPTPLGPLKR